MLLLLNRVWCTVLRSGRAGGLRLCSRALQRDGGPVRRQTNPTAWRLKAQATPDEARLRALNHPCKTVHHTPEDL